MRLQKQVWWGWRTHRKQEWDGMASLSTGDPEGFQRGKHLVAFSWRSFCPSFRESAYIGKPCPELLLLGLL